MNQKKLNKDKAIDPEKLKKDIKWGGLIGIIMGLLIIAIDIVAYYASLCSLNYVYTSIIIGLAYIIPSAAIRKAPIKAKNWIYFLMTLSVALGVLSFYGGGKPGLLLIIFIFELWSMLKKSKQLEENPKSSQTN